MFLLFLNLYMAMFTGTWTNYQWQYWINYNHIKENVSLLGTFITSIFGDNQMTNLGDLFNANMEQSLLNIVCFILALITSIGIVVLAVKGIKKVFGVFFMGIRR